MNALVLILGMLSILFQFAAAYFGYRIYNYNRLTKWWLALVLAFIIQGLRRILTTLNDYTIISFSSTQITDRLIQFSISLLILVGLWAMWKNFESFEFLEKKVKNKLKK